MPIRFKFTINIILMVLLFLGIGYKLQLFVSNAKEDIIELNESKHELLEFLCFNNNNLERREKNSALIIDNKLGYFTVSSLSMLNRILFALFVVALFIRMGKQHFETGNRLLQGKKYLKKYQGGRLLLVLLVLFVLNLAYSEGMAYDYFQDVSIVQIKIDSLFAKDCLKAIEFKNKNQLREYTNNTLGLETLKTIDHYLYLLWASLFLNFSFAMVWLMDNEKKN